MWLAENTITISKHDSPKLDKDIQETTKSTWDSVSEIAWKKKDPFESHSRPAEENNITTFQQAIFVYNPMRAFKMAELMYYTSYDNKLQGKLIGVLSSQSSFFKITDNLMRAKEDKTFKPGKDEIAWQINDFLDELDKSNEDFSRNEMETIEKSLKKIFSIKK